MAIPKPSGHPDNIRELGEFGLIERLAALLPPASSPVVVGIGDDAAAVGDGPKLTLYTTDLLLEEVHFRLDLISPEGLGYKALAVNVSDIAAMGGSPEYGLVATAWPLESPVETCDGIYRGLALAAEHFGVELIGGDTSRSGNVILSIFLTGRVGRELVQARSGGQVGDILLVTGSLGASAAGLELLLHAETEVETEVARSLKERHLRPVPRVREAGAAARGGSRAMIDLSDGLASDLGHICKASGVGAEVDVDAIPVEPGVAAVAHAFGKDPLAYALFGGEDYELLMAVPPEKAHEVMRAVREETGTAVTAVGRLVLPEKGTSLLHADGRARPLERGGWDHFRA